MPQKYFIPLTLTVAAIVLSAGPGWAELYKWKDDKGKVHYTDQIGKVPPQYRKSSKVQGFEDKPTSPAVGSPQNEANSPAARRAPSTSNRSTRTASPLCRIAPGLQPKANIDALAAKLESRYSIRVSYERIPQFTWKLDYQTANSSDFPDLLFYLQLFCEEFSKYPPSFVRRTRLSEVVLVKNLAWQGAQRGAIPDFLKEILVLNFEGSSYKNDYLRHIVHHEYYHLIEQELNGDAYWKDPKWAAFNETAFKYGSGGRYARGSNMFAMTHPAKGFVNLYSASGLEEDKAEIFACLFMNEEYQRIQPWTRSDPILAAKIRYMKNFMLGIDSGIRQDFWR